MKNLRGPVLAFIATLATGVSAHSADLMCAGQYFIYTVTAAAKTSGSHVTGLVTVAIINNGKVFRSTALQPTASDIEVGKYVSFSANAQDGTVGSLLANYNASTEQYSGTATMSSKSGTINANVTCTLTASRRGRRVRRHL